MNEHIFDDTKNILEVFPITNCIGTYIVSIKKRPICDNAAVLFCTVLTFNFYLSTSKLHKTSYQ